MQQMPAYVVPTGRVDLCEKPPVYATKNVGDVPTIEEVLLRRKLQALQEEESQPPWVPKKYRRPPSNGTGIDLPPESLARELTREALRLSTRPSRSSMSSRKRRLPNNSNNNQLSSQRSRMPPHSLSAPLPYLRPLTGASPPPSRGLSFEGGLSRAGTPFLPSRGQNKSGAGQPEYQEQGALSADGVAVGEQGADPDVVRALTVKCGQLVLRLQMVEQELADVRLREPSAAPPEATLPCPPTAQRSFSPPRSAPVFASRPKSVGFHPSTAGGGSNGNRGGLSKRAMNERKQELYANVDLSLKDLSTQVNSLSDVYTTPQALEAKKNWAIGKIVIFVRALLFKRRFLHYQRCLLRWRLDHAPEVIDVLRYEVDRQKHLLERMKFMASKRNIRLLGSVCVEWCRLTKLHLPRKRKIMARVNTIVSDRNRRLKLACAQGWWRVTVGPESGKGVRKRAQERNVVSRERLQQKVEAGKLEQGLITKDMVEKEVQRLIMEEVERRYKHSICYKHFAAMQQLLSIRRIMEKRAMYHHRVKIERVYFYPWREYAFLVAKGIARMKWKGPGRYTIRYNQNQVDTMARKRLLRMSMEGWRQATELYRETHRRYRRKMTEHANQHFFAWRALTKEHMRLRRLVVKNWKDYARDMYEVPFKLWFLHAEKRRKDKAARDRVVTVFRRSQMRKWLSKIMRRWRHQAIYGRTDGLYTRFDLVRSLGQHKDHTRDMVEEMERQEKAVREMQVLVQEREALICKYEEDVRRREEEALSLSMMVHHAEQEVLRNQSLVECLAIMYPNAVTHILRIQPSFDFRERGLRDVVKYKIEQEAKCRPQRRSPKGERERDKERDVSPRPTRDKDRGDSPQASARLQASLHKSHSGRSADGSVISQRGGSEDTAQTPSDGSHSGSQSHAANTAAASNSSSSGPTESASTSSDVNLPQRVNWALGITDFRTALEAFRESVVGAVGFGAEAPPRLPPLLLELMDPVRVLSIFEFMRTGDLTALTESDAESWHQYQISPPDSHGRPHYSVSQQAMMAVQGAIDAQASVASASGSVLQKADEVSKMTGPASFYETSAILEEGEDGSLVSSEETSQAGTQADSISIAPTEPVTSHPIQGPGRTNWPALTSEAPTAKKRTWSDFLLFLNAQLPPSRRTEVLREKMLRQLYLSKSRAESILLDTYAGEKPARDLNTYSNTMPDPPVQTLPQPLEYHISDGARDDSLESEHNSLAYHPFHETRAAAALLSANMSSTTSLDQGLDVTSTLTVAEHDSTSGL